MFSHYSSFISLVLVLFVWGTIVTLCVTVTNIYYFFYLHVSVVNVIDYSDMDKMMDINNYKC